MSKTTIKHFILVPNTEARKDAYRFGCKSDKMRWITIEITGTFYYDGGDYETPPHSEYDIEEVYELIGQNRVELPEEDDEWLEYFYEEIQDKAEEAYFKSYDY